MIEPSAINLREKLVFVKTKVSSMNELLEDMKNFFFFLGEYKCYNTKRQSKFQAKAPSNIKSPIHDLQFERILSF
jgi:hypothetical protein